MKQSSFQNAAEVTYVNSLRLLLVKDSVVIVEGKTDQRVYQPYFKSKILAVGCKNNIKKAIKTLNTPSQLARCRAIPDRDYDFFLNKDLEDEHYVYTDAHSLETLLWKTEDGTLLEHVLSRFLQQDVSDAVDKMKELYHLAFHVAYQLGICRMVNEKNAWMVSQQEELREFMFDDQTGLLKVDVYLEEVLKRAGRPWLLNQYLSEVEENMKRDYDPWEITHGHDISRIFTYYLQYYCRQNHISLEGRSAKDFEFYSRDEAACCHLEKTHAIQTIQSWESKLSKSSGTQ